MPWPTFHLYGLTVLKAVLCKYVLFPSSRIVQTFFNVLPWIWVYGDTWNTSLYLFIVSFVELFVTKTHSMARTVSSMYSYSYHSSQGISLAKKLKILSTEREGGKEGRRKEIIIMFLLTDLESMTLKTNCLISPKFRVHFQAMIRDFYLSILRSKDIQNTTSTCASS